MNTPLVLTATGLQEVNPAVTTKQVDTVDGSIMAQIMLGGKPTDLFVEETGFYNPFTDDYEACVVDNDYNLVSGLPEHYNENDLLKVLLDLLAQGAQCRAEHSEGR